MSAGDYLVEGEWLVQDVDRHTCGTAEGGHYGAHEPGCGTEPVARVADLLEGAVLLEEIREKAREWVGAHDGGSWPPWACLALGIPVDVVERRAYLADRFPCGHVGIVVRGCGGCDPSAIELVLDDGASPVDGWRPYDPAVDLGPRPLSPLALAAPTGGEILSAFWIYGLCPGCDDWSLQVDVDAYVAADEVEDVVAEHRAECPGLDAIATERGIASHPETCPRCRHAWHDGLGFCANMASDNDCACPGSRL